MVINVYRSLATATVFALVSSTALLTYSPAVAAPTDYSLMKVTIGSKTFNPRWDPCSTISVKVNPNALPASRRAGALADVKTSLAKVGAAAGVKFVFKGKTSFIPTGSTTSWSSKAPAEVTVAWARTSGSKFRSSLLIKRSAASGGQATKSWKVGSKTKVASGRGFLVVDAGKDYLFRPGSGPGLSRNNLLQHELGHVLGLDHVPSSTKQLMGPYISSASRDGLADGDRAGLWKVGAGSGCVKVPKSIWKPI